MDMFGLNVAYIKCFCPVLKIYTRDTEIVPSYCIWKKHVSHGVLESSLRVNLR